MKCHFSNEFLEIQIELFNKTLIEIILKHGENSDEVIRFSKRLDTLTKRKQKIDKN